MEHDSVQTDLREQIRTFWNQNVKRYRTYSITAGIVMLVLGVLCLIYPFETIIAMEYAASLLLIVYGGYQLHAFTVLPVFLRTGGVLLSGILNIMLGILLLSGPQQSMMATYAYLFAVDLLMIGIEQCVAYHRMKYYGLPNTGWMLLEGVVNIVVAVIFLFMPQTTVAISLLVAVYLLVEGGTLLYSGISAKDLKV